MDALKCGGGANESDYSEADNAAPSLTADCAIFDFVLYTVTGGSLCAFGVVGNALSFVVLQLENNSNSSSAKSSATPFLLRALAVADGLVLVAAVPLYALPSVYPFTGYLEGYYELYHGIMSYLWPIYLMSYTGTILMTVLVSLERYLAVCRPVMSISLRSVEQSRRHVIGVVVFAVLYNIPRFFEYHRVQKCSQGSSNSTRTIFELSAFGENKLYRILYANALYFVVMLGGPLLSLAFFNVKLLTALKAQKRRRREMTLATGGRGQQLQQDLTLVLVVVIFAFSLCQTPTFVDHILWTIVSKTETSCGHWHYYYTAVADTLAILNSSINFIIYVLTSTKFRRGLIRLFGGGGGGGGRRVRESTAAAEGATLTTVYRPRHLDAGLDGPLTTEASVCAARADGDGFDRRLFESTDDQKTRHENSFKV